MKKNRALEADATSQLLTPLANERFDKGETTMKVEILPQMMNLCFPGWFQTLEVVGSPWLEVRQNPFNCAGETPSLRSLEIMNQSQGPEEPCWISVCC